MNNVMSPKPRSAPPATARFMLCAALCLVPVAIFAGPASAQVPEDHVVVGTIAYPPTYPNTPGTSGLFYVKLGPKATGGGTITPVTGLPSQLTVKYPNLGGCFSVLRRPSDGTVFVGGGAGQNGWFHVHILKLAGPIVLTVRSVRVGQVPNSPGFTRSVGDMALLPDGRVLVVGSTNLQNGPMRVSPLAILDDSTTPPTVTPVILKPALPTPFVYGVALSPDGRTAYVTNQASAPRFIPGRLYAIDITKNQPVAPVLLHTWTKSLVAKLTAGRDGTLYATRFDPVNANPVTPSIDEIRISNTKATVRSIPLSAKVAPAGPSLERATGQFVFVTGYLSTTVNNNSVLMSDGKGTVTVLAGPPTGGWGMPFAIDINNTFEAYGQTRGQDRHWFQEFPNPGGSPVVGNATFSLTLQSKAKPSNTFLVISTSKANISFMNINVLADPGPASMVFALAPSTSNLFPAGIPNNPLLHKTRVYVQAVHIESGGGWAATRGLDLYIR